VGKGATTEGVGSGWAAYTACTAFATTEPQLRTCTLAYIALLAQALVALDALEAVSVRGWLHSRVTL
jgi:hypothetical protein